MWPNLKETADLVTFTEEILNGKLHFLSSETSNIQNIYNMIYIMFLNKLENFVKKCKYTKKGIQPLFNTI